MTALGASIGTQFKISMVYKLAITSRGRLARYHVDARETLNETLVSGFSFAFIAVNLQPGLTLLSLS